MLYDSLEKNMLQNTFFVCSFQFIANLTDTEMPKIIFFFVYFVSLYIYLISNSYYEIVEE